MTARKNLTIADIAQHAGVSIKTVSRVFNNSPNVRQQKRDLVLGVARDLGYRPNISARQLASKRSFVISHFHDNPNTDYLSEIYDGMRRACSEQGYYAVAEKLEAKKGSYRAALLEYLLRYEVDGVILSPPVSDDEAVIREIEKRDIPYALISPGKKKKKAINVFIDEKNAGRSITEFLIARGHEKLAFISGLDSHAASREREAGFWEAIDAFSIPKKNVVRLSGNFSMRSGFAAFDKLMKKAPNVTGIFAANDEMAVGTIVAALRAGKKVPEELSVVGFDDSPFARSMWPTITSLAQPVDNMAHVSTQKLIDWIHAESLEESRFEFATQIIVRDSCP
ncbi:MAG: LacI family DNA-binding transcriptional regulator [Alphaproteobacteria bacterium]|nr:LacI family DNA-binding transcriptional regulator [Alphaproteobacteria bacterium]